MKNYQLIIFLSIVLAIYSLVNIYIFFKGYNVLAAQSRSRTVYTFLFIILALTFVAGKFLEASHSSLISDILNVAGGFWMGFMLYSFLFLVLSDMIFGVLRLTGILDPGNTMAFKKTVWTGTVIITVLLIITGFINALSPVVRSYRIDIDKEADGVKNLRIAAVSDIHLGSTIRKRSIRKLSSMLEELKPDVVFLLGDIVDGEMGPVLRDDLLKHFKAPHAVEGLYAITGNHEYIGGAGKTIPYIESKGIRVLKDEIVRLKGGIQVIGRLDRDSRRYFGHERTSLSELAGSIDHNKPVILLDHQPFNLEEAVNGGVDLQLSGHTHNGQMWPLNFLTSAIYELSYGYTLKGKTHFIVSSGYGLWGPRIRLGSRSEILLVEMNFLR